MKKSAASFSAIAFAIMGAGFGQPSLAYALESASGASCVRAAEQRLGVAVDAREGMAARHAQLRWLPRDMLLCSVRPRKW